jgi:hypothetical protein
MLILIWQDMDAEDDSEDSNDGKDDYGEPSRIVMIHFGDFIHVFSVFVFIH